MKRWSRGFAGRSALFFLFLTVAMTWPLAASLGDHFSSRRDFYLGLWDLWWVARALTEADVELFRTSYLYFPFGTGLEVQPLTLLQTVPAVPLTLTVGPVVTYNLLVLLAFWAGGWVASLWVRALTADDGAAVVGGVVFTFSPYHYTYLSELNLVAVGVLPLYFLAAHALGRRGSWTSAALAGAALAAVGLTSWYYGVAVGLAAVALSLARLARGARPFGRRVSLEAVHWGACLALLGPVVLRLWPAFSAVDPDTGPVEEYPGMGLFMRGFKGTDVSMALHSYVGIGALVLAAVGCRTWRCSGPLALMAVAFTVFSMGASVRVLGVEVPLPYAWLQSLPVVSAVRYPDRFFAVAQLGVAGLAGYGVCRLRGAVRGPENAYRVAALCVFLLLLEYWPGALPSHPPPETVPVPRASEGTAGGVFHLPTRFRNLDAENMLHQLEHGRPIAGGYLTRRDEAGILKLLSERPASLFLSTAPARLPRGVGRGLRALGFAYVCIQKRPAVAGVEPAPHRVRGPFSLTSGSYLAQRLFPAYRDDAMLGPIATDWIRVLEQGWGAPVGENRLATVFEIP